MKKVCQKLLAAALMLIISLSGSAFAEDNISVYLDGNQIQFDVQPQIINDRTMVPLRTIFEALGASVDWNEETRTVTSAKNSTYVSLTVDSADMSVNGTSVALDAPACVIDGRTLVPIRAISEAYNTSVDWDASSRTVYITTYNANTTMTTQEFDNGMAKGIAYFNEGLYYEAKDELQWFCDANWGNMNSEQQKYALDYLDGTKSRIAQLQRQQQQQQQAAAQASSYSGSSWSSGSSSSVRNGVYRTPTGKRYHFSSTCGGKNSYATTLEAARSAGLTPCSKCAY